MTSPMVRKGEKQNVIIKGIGLCKYSLFCGSASVISDSTVTIVSKVTANSPSDNIFFALSEYKNSTSLGANV